MNFNNEPRGRYQAARELGVAAPARILKMLAHGPMRTGEIVTRIERTRAVVNARLSRLKDAGRIERVSRVLPTDDYGWRLVAPEARLTSHRATSRTPWPFVELHRDPFAHANLAMTIRR